MNSIVSEAGARRRKRKPRRWAFSIIRASLVILVYVLLYTTFRPVQHVKAATTRKVYTGGTNTGGTYDLTHLQTAINDAAQNDACGSEILLEQNQVFSAPDGGFVLKELVVATPTWDCITIRTGVDSSGALLSAALLPSAETRVTAGTYRSVFAEFKPTTNNSPAIRTVWPAETGVGCVTPCVGSGWTLKWLEFSPYTNWLKGKLVLFGSNKVSTDSDANFHNDAQDTLAEVPQYLTLYQCDLHGDPIFGQDGGLYVSSKDARILYNSFTDFKSQNETQAITFINWVGPVQLEHNYIEATGENIMTGGGDSKLQQSTTITGIPTASLIALTATTELFNNQFISVTHAGIEYGGITCALSGSVCALGRALPVTPSAGDVVKWDRIGGGLTAQYNWFYKRPEWRNPIMLPPTAVSVHCTPGGGTLVDGTYSYRLASLIDLKANAANLGVPANSAASTAVTDTLVGGPGKCTVDFTEADNDTSGTRIYRNATQYFTVADGVASYVDTGTTGTAGTPPSNGSTWSAKNNVELKHCDGGSPAGNCLFQYNVIDYSWCCSQSMIVNFKTWNQSGGDVSSTVRYTTFQYNWVRHMNRAINLSGTDAELHPSGFMSNVVIRNNLWTDISPSWGGGDSTIQLSTGNYSNNVGSRGCEFCSFTHNTFLVDVQMSNGPFWFVYNNSTRDSYDGFIFSNNIVAQSGSSTANIKMFWGDIGGVAQGVASWNAGTNSLGVAHNNVWPGCNSTACGFSTGSFFPTDAELKAVLVDYPGCLGGAITGCALNGSSLYDSAGDDGLDIGADITAIKVGTDIALSTSSIPPATNGRTRLRLRIRGGL